MAMAASGAAAAGAGAGGSTSTCRTACERGSMCWNIKHRKRSKRRGSGRPQQRRQRGQKTVRAAGAGPLEETAERTGAARAGEATCASEGHANKQDEGGGEPQQQQQQIASLRQQVQQQQQEITSLRHQ
eukprot:15458238-Alexandrium_andersonii.AAC.1